MFTKPARLRNFNRDSKLETRRNAALTPPSNDNQPVRIAALSRRMRRPLLFCRWHKTPAGALECRWYGEAPTAFDEGISWLAVA